MKTRYEDVDVFVTKDGSFIRELMHPANDNEKHFGVEKQSLAEAIVPAGIKTKLHKHRATEELYHITSGEGLMTLGASQFTVAEGNTICIPPGTPHCIENTGKTDLKILCCCAPAYSHDDTEILES